MKKFYVFALLAALSNTAYSSEIAQSKIVDLKGKEIGEASFTQGPQGVLINLKVNNLTPGKHGLHFHEVGSCDPADGFKKAGMHIMPSGKAHGLLSADGPHEGDLPNLVVGKDGSADVELYTTMVRLKSCESNEKAKSYCAAAQLLDKDASTLIIHANPDDQSTQPTGGSGDRVACGVVK